jgi:hypothetical protein
VQGFHKGQHITVKESEILDWCISNPDGSEDGNLIGKYIDSLQGR